MNKVSSSCLVITFALCTFAWTGVGESSNPELLTTELPLSIVNECEKAQPGPPWPAPLASIPSVTEHTCQGMQEFVSRWVSRNQGSDLFIVYRAACAGNQCSSWLVEKTPGGPVTRLAMQSRFRLISSNNTHPDVEMQRQVSDSQTSYIYYAWAGDHYVKTETRDTYRVNGVECGTRDECYAEALKANRTQHTDQALKIWETVHGLSWI